MTLKRDSVEDPEARIVLGTCMTVLSRLFVGNYQFNYTEKYAIQIIKVLLYFIPLL